MVSRFVVRCVCVVSAALVGGPTIAVAQGSIGGQVSYVGDPGGGTQIEVAAHVDMFSAPVATFYASIPGGPYQLDVPDGTYYVSAMMSRDGIFGEPRPEDDLVWYDQDGDGSPDTITVSGGPTNGHGIAMGHIYVDIDATGLGIGTSWADAFTDLQAAISSAVSGYEIWVAEGTYLPGSARADSFVPKPGVRVYGGFTGSETTRWQRDWNAHPTILSCEIGAAGTTDNCYHVVNAAGANRTAVLDGFVLTDGNANGGGDHHNGGGILVFNGGLTVANSTVTGNHAGTYGGGVAVNAVGTVFLANSSITANVSSWHGGGLHIAANAGTPSTIVNSVFTGNSAFRGGGIAIEGQVFAPGLEPILVNLSLSGNSAGGEGHGIHTNTTTFNPPGGAPVTIENSIIWDGLTSYGGSDTAVVNFSIVAGGWGTGSHILTADPSFADAELRLELDSTAIDAGDNNAVPLDLYDVDGNHWTDEPIKTDRDFNDRFRDLPYVPNTGSAAPDEWPVDMGAYEAWDPALIFAHNFDSGDLDPWTNVVGGP
jgi:hypothetical protein